jgi:hypothetical protein
LPSILHIFIEGDSDEYFVNWIVEPSFSNKGIDVITHKYANMTKENITKLILSITELKEDFICLTDYRSPCITSTKEKLQRDKFDGIDTNKIVIVKKVIESWYLAGLSCYNCKKMKIPENNITDGINKTDFNNMVAKSKYQPRIDCMLEILKRFDIMIAKQQNHSFNYFYEKYLR